MPAECSNTDAHPLEDWDVVDLNDLPYPEKVLPNGSEVKHHSSSATRHSSGPPNLPRSSGSAGSRSLFSSLALRVAKVFSASNTSVSRGSSFTGDATASSDRDLAYNSATSAMTSVSSDRRRHNSASLAFIYKCPPQLLVSDLSNYMDYCGCITMRAQLKRDVFERGMDASIRQMVWPILLGVYPPAMSQNERVAWLKKRSNDYLRLRSEWQNLLVDHHGNFVPQQDRCQSRPKSRGFSSPSPTSTNTCNLDTSYLRSIVTAVRKDAIRTDRTHSMFNAEDSPWTTAMFNLLVTYAFAHPSIGYCQGMSDLAAPLLVVMRDEAAAYICFSALMVRMRRHFSPSDDSSIASKFTVLALLLRHYCPRLHRFLVNQGADDLLFAYRWLFLEMKREFPLDDCLQMLEVIWAAVPDQYLPSASVELALAETDYRRRASVLTGETVSNISPGKVGSDSEPTISEPPLFDASTNNPTPPRRLISCATAARCGSQYYLDGHGVRHSSTNQLLTSSSLLHIPVGYGRAISDCTAVARVHSSSYAVGPQCASSGGPLISRFHCTQSNRGKQACCCQPTPSFQRLISREGDSETSAGNRSAPLPVTAHRLSGSGNRGRRLLRKRRTGSSSSSLPVPIDNSAQKTATPTGTGEIGINHRQTEPIYEAQLDTTATDDSAVGGASRQLSCTESNVLRREVSSNVTTESEAEQVTNRDGLATASSSAEYDASSEYGEDADEEPEEDSRPSSLNDDSNNSKSSDLSTAQQSALFVALNANSLNGEMCGGSSTAEMSVTTRPNPASTSSPFSNLPSTPLNASNNSRTGLTAEQTVDVDSTQCSQAEEAICLAVNDETMDDTCEVAMEAILSPSLNASPTVPKNDNAENNNERFASFGSSVTTISSNSHYQFDSGLFTTDLVTSEDEDVELPTLHELGDSPFVVFVALTLLLQHRGKLLEGYKDYNEIHIYFDKLVRKHNVETVLVQARRIYNAFINGKSAGSGCSSSNNGNGLSALFGMRRTTRSRQSAASKHNKTTTTASTRSMPSFQGAKNKQSEQREVAKKKDTSSDKSRRSSP